MVFKKYDIGEGGREGGCPDVRSPTPTTRNYILVC